MLYPHLISAFIMIFFAKSSFACLHYAQTYKDSVKEGTQSVFLYHDGTNAHVILQTEVKAGKKLPRVLAWVLPFPSVPSRYQEREEHFFEQLQQLFPPDRSGGLSRSPKGKSMDRTIKVHDMQRVGNYQIEPIEILAEGAGEPFQAWLKRNGFQGMPDELQKIYLRKGDVFLAIKASLDGPEARLKPLQVTYRASQLSYPIRFTHHERSFDLEIYWLLHKMPKTLPVFPYLELRGLVSFDKGRWPTLLQNLFIDKHQAFILRYRGRNLNSAEFPFARLNDDPSIGVN